MKYSFSKKKRFSRSKKNSKKQKRVRKTFRNKMLKGGFNQAQFTGAFAVAAVMGMDKVVLMPKNNTSKRYDFVIDKDNKPTLSNHSRLNIPGTKSTIRVINFDIYIGSTTDNLLIKIDGNNSVINRLAKLTQTVITPENSTDLINTAQASGVITPTKAAELTELKDEVLPYRNQILKNGNKQLLEDGQANNVNPEGKMFIQLVQIIIALIKLLFDCLVDVLSKQPSRDQSQQSSARVSFNTNDESSDVVIFEPKDESSAMVSVNTIEEEQSQALVVFLGNEDKNGNVPDPADVAAAAKTIYETTLNDIEELPQYIDNGENEYPTIVVDNQHKCVTPYNTTSSNIKDRIKSCNKIGPPHKDFKDQRYDHLTRCIEDCHT